MNHRSPRDLESRNLSMFPTQAGETSNRESPGRSRRNSSPSAVSPPLNISAPFYFPKGGMSDSPSSSSQWIPPHGDCRSFYYPPHDHVRFNGYGVLPIPHGPNLYRLPPFPWLPHQQHNPYRMELFQRSFFHNMESEIGPHFPRFPRPESTERDNVRGSRLRRQPETHDNHNDLRLDVDNMSYEELLDLEEMMGTVSLGLKEEKINNLMKKKVYCSGCESMEMCCVCQEDMEDGETMGVLDCGHGFHVDCVKLWLKIKNVCPICKKNALVS